MTSIISKKKNKFPFEGLDEEMNNDGDDDAEKELNDDEFMKELMNKSNEQNNNDSNNLGKFKQNGKKNSSTA